jgi:hypothetical protein
MTTQTGLAHGDLLVWRTDVVLAAVVAMVGAHLLAVPIAHVYRMTRHRHEYDPAVTETILVLPAVVAGIVIVVQGSLALSFSLVGVAAAVRFRSNLKDTNDAVFIFFAIALGVAAGVHGLDLGVALCLVFCATILVVSRRPYGARPAPLAATARKHGRPGDDGGSVLSPGLYEPVVPREGIVTVHAANAERIDEARGAVEARLAEDAKHWGPARTAPRANGEPSLEYRVRLRKRSDPRALLESLNEAVQPLGATVEYQESDGATETSAPR